MLSPPPIFVLVEPLKVASADLLSTVIEPVVAVDLI